MNKKDDFLPALEKLISQVEEDESVRFNAFRGFVFQKMSFDNTVYRAREPLGNGGNGRFNGELRDEVLNREVFYDLREVKAVIKNWRKGR